MNRKAILRNEKSVLHGRVRRVSRNWIEFIIEGSESPNSFAISEWEIEYVEEKVIPDNAFFKLPNSSGVNSYMVHISNGDWHYTYGSGSWNSISDKRARDILREGGWVLEFKGELAVNERFEL